MSNLQIRFKYNQKEIIIQCQKNDLIKDILGHYATKSGLSLDEIYFLCNGKKVNPDETLTQLNNKDPEILILVYDKENVKNGDEINKMIKSI